MVSKVGHGGARRGAGRPALPQGSRLIRVSVSLPESQVKRLRSRGGGNLSAGIRVLAEAVEALEGAPVRGVKDCYTKE